MINDPDPVILKRSGPALCHEENGYHGWTEEELVRETVSNFESLEGVDSVEWVTQSPYATFHELIRVTLRAGSILRLAIAYRDDEEVAETFDDSFGPG